LILPASGPHDPATPISSSSTVHKMALIDDGLVPPL
jgi:hypothetical protein